MPVLTCDLAFPEDWDLDTLHDRLGDELHIAEGPLRELSRTYWDSFDWLVYQADAVLCDEDNGKQRVLGWRQRDSASARYQQLISSDPGFAAELPTGALRDALIPVLEMRALLPLVRVQCRIQTLNLLNEDDKTVARLALTDSRASTADGELGGCLAKRLCLLPVRGYADEFATLARLLDLPPAAADQFSEALAAVGRAPLDYRSKLNYQLQPDERADIATKTILKGLLTTLEANIEGTRANLDSEFLHDLRVATRRTRSALTQIKGVFPPEVVENYKQRFAWLGQVTSPIRDLDVYLLEFDGFQNSLAKPLQPHLEPMRSFLKSHYQDEHKILVRQLRSPHFHRLLREWQRFLDAPVPTLKQAVPGAPNARMAVLELANQRIWKMLKRVRKEGRAITPDSDPEALHALRKNCKKLRYLMEFFQSLYPRKPIKAHIKVLKVLLDNLGNFQDLAVQADKLGHIARQMSDSGQAGVETLLAMGALVGGLLERQQQVRLEFARIFSEFDSAEHRQGYRALFTGQPERTA